MLDLNTAAIASAVVNPQPDEQNSDTETYSRSILGPSYFTLRNLKITGSSVVPAAPSQSPYIVASNEKITVSLKIEFNDTPLTRLLLCLGVNVAANFGFEGFGAKANEKDVSAAIVTKKDVFDYIIKWEGTPEQADLSGGLYQVGATVTVGPGDNPCAQYIFGYGYIERVLLQVYKAA